MLEKESTRSASSCEIVSTRIVNFTREKVFNAWSDPAQIVNWWGPKAFTNTISAFDFREGGKWSSTMHGPADNKFQNEAVFVEINKPDKIVTDHLSKPQFRLTVTFEALGEKTKITFIQLFESQGVRDIVNIYAGPGNQETFDKLEAHLGQLK